MIKKTVIGVCGLIFAVALSLPALADQSIGFQKYFKEGLKAFKEHNDQQALRFFKIAQVYDPTDEELNKYLSILYHRGVVLELNPPVVYQKSAGYRYYLNAGIKAFRIRDTQRAIHYFRLAQVFDPYSKEAQSYLNILSLPQAPFASAVPLEQVSPQPQPAIVTPPQAAPTTPMVQTAQPQPIQQYSLQPQPQSIVIMPQPVLYSAVPHSKGPAAVLSLAQITNNGQIKPKMQIEFHSFIIIGGQNIQRFLAVDEGFLGVKMLDTSHLEIDALRIGATFLHIWDDFGLHTLYIEVVFPKTFTAASLQAMNTVQHAQPFIVTYSNDWSTYYQGKNVSQLKRQSFDFNETLGVTGETPYGFFDTSGSYTDFDSFSQFDTYTIGLSQIPLEGTSNFNVRGFDAFRYMSPLTLPGTRMRGAFADVDLMDNILGLSVSHGQEQVPLGFISAGESQFNDSYIDAVKLTLFPTSATDRYSFNFATGYGPDRQPYLSDHVYSLEGQHSFNDFLTLNAEEASDTSHDSSLASLRWQEGAFRSNLNFRDIDKDYSTISTLPANQGEVGGTWTTEGDFKNFTENSFFEAYRDTLYPNPSDTNALNYDGNGHLKADITPHVWSDTDLNYIDTPGEISPMRSLGANQRLSRSFGIWDSLKGTVFGGVGYQNSHSTGSDTSDYEREDVIGGIQLPLTNRISTFANYEYDWLQQPEFGDSNPSIINAGFEYQRQFNPKFSVTSQVVYRDELGVENTYSFLSGEQSVIFSSSFNYNPTPDVSIFADGDASRVVFHVANQPYDDFEVHVGMRLTFGGSSYWDPLGTVSGIVFKDRNTDGKFGFGDEAIEGVKVRVGDKVAVTGKDGRYRIQIRAKGVEVSPVLDTVPGGLLFSTPQTLNIQIFQGRTSRADFGFTSQTGIYGIVFVDKNGSGVPNDNDQFIGKVKVVLDGKIIQKSDPHGAFYFRKVTPGIHTISIDIDTLALNMIPRVKLENEIDVTEGTNYMFNIPVQVKQAASQEK